MKISFDSQDLKQKPDKFNSFRERLHEIIFEAETPQGKLFDVILLGMILLSILVLMLETVPAYQARWQDEFKILDWTFTLFSRLNTCSGCIVSTARKNMWSVFLASLT